MSTPQPQASTPGDGSRDRQGGDGPGHRRDGKRAANKAAGADHQVAGAGGIGVALKDRRSREVRWTLQIDERSGDADQAGCRLRIERGWRGEDEADLRIRAHRETTREDKPLQSGAGQHVRHPHLGRGLQRQLRRGRQPPQLEGAERWDGEGGQRGQSLIRGGGQPPTSVAERLAPEAARDARAGSGVDQRGVAGQRGSDVEKQAKGQPSGGVTTKKNHRSKRLSH
jgi:hypothetical protein